MTSKKLTNALRVQRNQTKRVDQTIYGSLGIPLGGRKLVEVPDRNSYVYVRLRDNQNEVIQAFNNKVATSYDLPVILRRESSRYIVEGVNTMRYNNNLNNFAAYLPKHGQVHSFFPNGDGDVVWAYSRQIMPLLVYPSPSNTGTNVSVYGQPLIVNNQWQYVGETGTVNLLTYVPTGSVSVMGLIYLDALTGNPGVLINSGTPMPNNTTGTGDVMPYIPVPNLSTQIPLAGVKINTGTTTIGWNNLYDLRNWVHAIPSGTASGGGGVDTIGFAGLANGVPIGTGTVLNVHGASFTRSGTVFDLNITGSSGGTVNGFNGIPIYNNGNFVATGTSISFNTNVSVTATGTNIYVEFPVTTYFRVGQPTSLTGITGAYWRVPDAVYASGSLGTFIQGHGLIPGIDYTEQYPISGTFQYLTLPGTGTYHMVHYGVPCTNYTVSTSLVGLTDSNGVLLVDSNGTQILDSNGN